MWKESDTEMPIGTAQQAALMVLLVAVIALIALVAAGLGGRERPRWMRIASRAAALVAALSLIVTIGLAITVNLAVRHGAYEFGEATVAETFEHISKSPTDQSAELPDEPKDLVVYMYRYTCPDCEDVHEYMMGWLKDQPVRYLCVSSRSEKGIALRDELGVKEVPSVIYFDSDGKAHMRIVYVFDDGSKTSVPDMDALDYLEERIAKDDK